MVERLQDFIREYIMVIPKLTLNNEDTVSIMLQEGENEISQGSIRRQKDVENDIELVEKAAHAIIVHFIGETEVIGRKVLDWGRRF